MFISRGHIANRTNESMDNNITGDSNEDLCLLCLRIPTADDQLIEKLKKIIDSNGRLVDYTIKRIMDKIYLQWG